MDCRVAMGASGCEDRSLLGCFSPRCLRYCSIVVRHFESLLRLGYEEPFILGQQDCQLSIS